MKNLDKIKALVRATRENKKITIFSENGESINIPLSKCNVDVSVTKKIKNIGVNFTLFNLHTKEKYISNSIDNDLPDTITVLYMLTIRCSYSSGYPEQNLFLGDTYIGKIKEVGKNRYAINVFDSIEISKKSYF